MKRFIIIAIFLLGIMTGCGQSADTSTIQQKTTAVITAESIAKNTETINTVLTDNLWNYDRDSLVFGNDLIISNNGENADVICSASEQAGIDTTKFKNGTQQTALATVNLLYPNRTDAGTAYFAFADNDILCGYYVYNGVYYSLDNKYPFESKSPFKAVENKQTVATFTALKSTIDLNSFADAGYGRLASIEGGLLSFYNGSRKKGIKLIGDVEFDEFVPMDIAIGNDYSCVLLGSYETAEIISESDYEDDEDNSEIIRTKSEKVVFIDENGRSVLPALELDLSIYTSVAFDNDSIALARDKAIDIYKIEDNTWTKVNRLAIGNTTAVKLRVADIDGDGNSEYIVSDGVNIFVYSYTTKMNLVWRTRFEVSAIKDFYVADLNGDNIKEIYVNDTNGFLTRYVVGENGFEVYSDGVATGEMQYYVAGDIDGNGVDEYLTIGDGNNIIVNLR